MKTKLFIITLLVLALAGASTAWANDQIVSTVTIPAGQPVPIIVNNGQPSGTIFLTYNYSGYSFPCGDFAKFNLNLAAQVGTGQQHPTYPVELDLVESGQGTPVQYSPDPAVLSVTSNSWTGSSVVTVSIDCNNLPSGSPYDGQEITGNLNEQTNPQGAKLNTISTIKVFIKLNFPTSCVKLYSFESDQDTGAPLNSVVVVAKKDGTVKATNPGQVSADGMVVNYCPQSISFDLAIGLDSDWITNPSGNPGNATFVYTYAGETDPSTYTLTQFGTGTAKGESLCITNFTLGSGDSMLTRVHSAIVSGLSLTSLNNPFTFSATLFAPDTACTGTYTGPAVDPSNPANSSLTYTVQQPPTK